MPLPRRSRRQAEATIADATRRPPETTSGWIRFNQAADVMGRAEQLDTEQETPTTPVEVVAPDRSLIPHLNRLLGKVYSLNSFIKRHPFKNTQDLETKIKNYTEILDQFITNVMGTLPRMRVDNFNTDVGNKLIISVFDNDRELASYFSYQYDAWDAFGNSLLAGTPDSSAEIELDIGQGSAEHRADLIKSIELLKKHIEKEYPHFTPIEEHAGALKKSRKRRRKNSRKRRRKKSIKRRRKKKSRRNRCK